MVEKVHNIFKNVLPYTMTEGYDADVSATHESYQVELTFGTDTYTLTPEDARELGNQLACIADTVVKAQSEQERDDVTIGSDDPGEVLAKHSETLGAIIRAADRNPPFDPDDVALDIRECQIVQVDERDVDLSTAGDDIKVWAVANHSGRSNVAHNAVYQFIDEQAHFVGYGNTVGYVDTLSSGIVAYIEDYLEHEGIPIASGLGGRYWRSSDDSFSDAPRITVHQ